MNGLKSLLVVRQRNEHGQMSCFVDTSASDALLDVLRFSVHNVLRAKLSTLEHEHFSTNALHCAVVTVIKLKRFLVQELSSRATSSALQWAVHCGPTVVLRSQSSSSRSLTKW